MAKLNLDTLRAEAGLEGHEVVIGGKTFTLPPILPLGAVDAETLEEAILALFGEDADVDHLLQHLSAIRSDRPLSEFDPESPQTDLDMIFERLYGITPKGDAPNRSARRARAKTKTKKA